MQKTDNKIIEVLGKDRLTLYFAYLERCKGVKQMEKHHPEGDVLNHSLQCFQWACKESNDIDLVLAALLHDIGKIENSKGHEKIAVKWLGGVCSVKTLWLIKHHMRIWNLLLGQMKRKKKVNYLIGHCWLPELISLARWDKMARNPNKQIQLNNEYITERLNQCIENHFNMKKLGIITRNYHPTASPREQGKVKMPPGALRRDRRPAGRKHITISPPVAGDQSGI